MRNFVVMSVGLLLLSACEPTVEDLAKDHEKRSEILATCAEMGMAKAQKEPRCKHAMEAQKLAIKQGFEKGVNSMLEPFKGGDDK